MMDVSTAPGHLGVCHCVTGQYDITSTISDLDSLFKSDPLKCKTFTKLNSKVSEPRIGRHLLWHTTPNGEAILLELQKMIQNSKSFSKQLTVPRQKDSEKRFVSVPKAIWELCSLGLSGLQTGQVLLVYMLKYAQLSYSQFPLPYSGTIKDIPAYLSYDSRHILGYQILGCHKIFSDLTYPESRFQNDARFPLGPGAISLHATLLAWPKGTAGPGCNAVPRARLVACGLHRTTIVTVPMLNQLNCPWLGAGSKPGTGM